MASFRFLQKSCSEVKKEGSDQIPKVIVKSLGCKVGERFQGCRDQFDFKT